MKVIIHIYFLKPGYLSFRVRIMTCLSPSRLTLTGCGYMTFAGALRKQMWRSPKAESRSMYSLLGVVN